MDRKMSPQVAAAYNIIQKRIISCDMSPESQISDYQLAMELGMSRAPVREALLLLAMDGLVRNPIGEKMTVSPIRLEDIEDILHVRNALECEAVKIIAGRGWLSAEQENELKSLHESFSKAATLSTVSEHYMLDDKFHSTIVDYSKSERIIDIISQMRLQMQRARWLNLAVPSRQAIATREHEDLLYAIVGKDKYKSLNCIETHLANSLAAFRKAFDDKHIKQLVVTISNYYNQS